MGNTIAGINVSEEDLHRLIEETKLDKSTLINLSEVFTTASPAVGTKKVHHHTNFLKAATTLRRKSVVSVAEPSAANIELNKTQFVKLMEDGNICQGEAAHRMFHLFDTDASGTVSLKEFLLSMSLLLKGTPTQKLEFIFDAYDVDESQELTVDEVNLLAAQMLSVYKSKGISVTGIEAEQTVYEFLKNLDSNGDGVITKEEFVTEGLKNPKLLPLLVSPSSEWKVADDLLQQRIQQMFQAAGEGKLEKVKQCVEAGCAVDSLGDSGETALLRASSKHPLIVNYLIQKGADVNLTNFSGNSPLHRAVTGIIECVDLLIAARAKVNEANLDGWTPFHNAVAYGSVEMVKHLIEYHHVNTSILTKVGMNALHIAACFDRAELIPYLKEQCSYKIDAVAAKEMKYTALHYACTDCHLNSIKALLECGANINVEDELGFTPLALICRRTSPHSQMEDCGKTLLTKRANLFVLNTEGDTVLHIAAKANNAVMCQLLVTVNRELLSKENKVGKTATSIAQRDAQQVLQKAYVSVLPDITRRLLEAAKQNDVAKLKELCAKGGDPNAEDGGGNNALYFAILNKNTEAASILLSNGAKADGPSRTFLHAAILTGSVPLVTCMLDRGATCDVQDAVGMQGIHTAAFSNKPDIVELLVARKVATVEDESGGKRPIHWAAQRGQKEAIERLIKLGVDKDALSDEGLTALHLAAANGRLSVIQLLLSYGANPLLTAPDGRAALHFAAQDGDSGCIKALMAASPSAMDMCTVGGDTVLHKLCEGGKQDAVLLFSKYGKLLIQKNDFGQTPMHLASRHGNAQFVTNLLTLHPDVDVNDEDNEGKSAIYYAAAARKEDVIEILKQKGGSFKEEEIDSPDIKFGKSKTYPKLESATSDALIDYLILTCDRIDDAVFRDMFFLSYRQFMKPSELLEKLMNIFNGDMCSNTEQIPNMRASSQVPRTTTKSSPVDSTSPLGGRRKGKAVKLRSSYQKSQEAPARLATDGNLLRHEGPPDGFRKSSLPVGHLDLSKFKDYNNNNNDEEENGKYLLIPENPLHKSYIIRLLRHWVKHSFMDFNSASAMHRFVQTKSKNLKIMRTLASSSNLAQKSPLLRGTDPDKNMDVLDQFIRDIDPEDDQELAKELELLEKAIDKQLESLAVVKEPPKRAIPKEVQKGKISYSDWSPVVVAEQFTIISKRLWNSLSLWEFYNVAFTKDNKDELCPNINALIRQINRVGDWAKTIILSIDDNKKRGACISFLIQTMDHCLKIRNYSDCMALATALQATPLERLKKSWKYVGDEEKEIMERTKKLLDPRGNYSIFRKRMEDSPNEPAIMFIGIIMGDIIHADEVPKKIEERHNWHKYELLGRLLSVVPRYQKTKYTFVVDEIFPGYFMNVELLDAEQVRLRSRELEPPPN